jgi:aromatic ring-cleaving dioxygenase
MATEHFEKLTLRKNWLDVHVYYEMGTRPDAVIVRDAIKEMGIPVYDLVDRPIGPHPLPMFEAHIHPSTASDFVEWYRQNGLGLRALLHPHTSNMLEDHTKHAYWIGEPLSLRLDIFS